MITLSIRQPWAWLILNAGKDIENRTWKTKVRGPVLIHAAKGMTRNQYDKIQLTLIAAGLAYFGPDGRLSVSKSPGWRVQFPLFDKLQRGGIVGMAEITDCVTESKSPWFTGPFGFVLGRSTPLPFEACKGRLGFFNFEPTN